LRPDELVLLESACGTLDLLHSLEVGMAGEPLTVKGSMGQLREHPLLSEARAQRALLRSLLVALKLPDDSGVAAGNRSVKARAAAQSRWASAHRAGA
jgi:hypothetical protein